MRLSRKLKFNFVDTPYIQIYGSVGMECRNKDDVRRMDVVPPLIVHSYYNSKAHVITSKNSPAVSSCCMYLYFATVTSLQ